MDTEIKRPNYFRAQFLVEKDFQDEQAYHRTMRQQHLLALHSWGVVGDGLSVTRTAGSDRNITISPGFAVDQKGQEIILSATRTIPLPEGDGSFVLSIRYNEFRADSDRYTGPGADALNTHTRITETPSFVFGPPGSDDVPLARISLNQNSPIDESVRRYASSWIAPRANIPGPMTINNTLTVAGGANVSENLAVAGNLEVRGNFGNADNDEITMHGTLRSAHSSGALEVDDAVHTTGSLTVDANVGIGTLNPSNRLHVRGNLSGSNVEAATVLFENTGTSALDFTTILALRASTVNTPDLRQAFIRFFNPFGQLGAIQSIGNKIQLSGLSADYAECLPRLQADEVIELGDIVGVFGGKITKTVTDAHHAMAITDRPIVLGNTPDPQDRHLYEPVAFLGQVPIKVRGSVQSGDFIIPCGLNDGTGIAVSPNKITPIQYKLVVGRAWESSDEEAVKRINTAVGLLSSYPQLSELLTILQSQQAEIATLKAELDSIQQVLERQYSNVKNL